MSTCSICSQDLVVELDTESFDEASSSVVGTSVVAPDNLLLQCGCHFHFQCLIDESSTILPSMACPKCGISIISSPTEGMIQPRIVTQYQNEGGLQSDLDIYHLVVEEAFLTAHPEARAARAFLSLCGEGDVEGMLELLRTLTEAPGDGDMSPYEVVRWQDPLDDGKTGLHAAVEKGKTESVWLLLWLASTLESERFPIEFHQASAHAGVNRDLQQGIDIRLLTNDQGQTARDVATEFNGRFMALLHAGVLVL